MSLLTDQEIDDIGPVLPGQNALLIYAREIEQAVIAKLATVSVVPDLVDMAKDSHGNCIICGVSPSKVIEALAAARVQANADTNKANDLLQKAVESLTFYIEEDDVIESMPGNEFWVDGKHTAETTKTAIEKYLKLKDGSTNNTA